MTWREITEAEHAAIREATRRKHPRHGGGRPRVQQSLLQASHAGQAPPASRACAFNLLDCGG